jgi:dihydroorotate dehydrogenase (NAD+) catalytic subunit
VLPPPVYDIRKSYEDNYTFGPFFNGIVPKPIAPSGSLSFLGREVASRIGIPAGPLLNSRWIGFYAKMGFDILTYKTVRSHFHASYPNPNCLYVPYHKTFDLEDLTHPLIGTLAYTPESMHDVTITNSFGMPSQEPKIWMEDVKKAQSLLGPGQILVVSIVGTPQEDIGIEWDFARAALLAKDAGAEFIEVNFSCPNVKGKEGQLFQDPESSGKVLRQIRDAIGNEVRLIMKVGFLDDPQKVRNLVEKTRPYLNAISAINTVTGTIINPEGRQALPGSGRERSGLCGSAIKPLALKTIRGFKAEVLAQKADITIIGVGGFNTVEDYSEFRQAGADFVMTATGAMWDPFLAYHLKQRLPSDV